MTEGGRKRERKEIEMPGGKAREMRGKIAKTAKEKYDTLTQKTWLVF